MTHNETTAERVVWSLDLPEPTMCSPDARDIGCTVDAQQCTCKWFCGDPGEAGCCYCDHSDVYEPCPRGGFWCDPACGDPSDDACCEPHERAFAQAAYSALRNPSSAPEPTP